MQDTRTCSHTQRIDDDHTGTEVCTECGLVLDTIYYAPSYYNKTSCEPRLNETLQNAREKARDICAILLIESEVIIGDAVHLYEELAKKNSIKRIKKRSLLAFCIWEALNRNDSPRSPQDIACAADIPAKDIRDVENTFDVKNTYCSPSSYVNRICACLHLSHNIRVGVSEIVSALYMFGSYRPENVIAACILLFVEEKRKRSQSSFHPEITVKYLCSKLGTSSSTVSKLLKRIDPKIISNVVSHPAK